jgi:hypothetical protein
MSDAEKASIYTKWARQNALRPEIIARLLPYMVSLCHLAFRKDVWGSIRHDIEPRSLKRALKGQIPLCKQALEKTCKPEARNTFLFGRQALVKTPEALYDLIWGSDNDTWEPEWAKKPFRVLYRQFQDVLAEIGNSDALDCFRQDMRVAFVLHSWVVPYPSGNKFWRQDGNRHRVWVSLLNKRLGKALDSPISFISEAWLWLIEVIGEEYDYTDPDDGSRVSYIGEVGGGVADGWEIGLGGGGLRRQPPDPDCMWQEIEVAKKVIFR